MVIVACRCQWSSIRVRVFFFVEADVRSIQETNNPVKRCPGEESSIADLTSQFTCIGGVRQTRTRVNPAVECRGWLSTAPLCLYFVGDEEQAPLLTITRD
jgi:hypothetical protein